MIVRRKHIRDTAGRRCSWRVACWLAAFLAGGAGRASAEDVSQPAILQWFEATYDTMEQRAADMFLAGYGTAYTPPPGRADQSNFSVGYDVYDRFDFGRPGNPTLYGTETGLKQFAKCLHRFDGRLDIDAVLNHNAYSDNDYVNPQFTSFQQAGGYPGVRVAESGWRDRSGRRARDIWRLSRPAYGGDYLNGQLSGLTRYRSSANEMAIDSPASGGGQSAEHSGRRDALGRAAWQMFPIRQMRGFIPIENLPGVTYFDPARTGQNRRSIRSIRRTRWRATRWRKTRLGSGDAVSAVDGAGRRRGWFPAGRRKAHDAICAEAFRRGRVPQQSAAVAGWSVDNVFMYGEVVPGDGQLPGESSSGFSLQLHSQGYQSGNAEHDRRRSRRVGLRTARQLERQPAATTAVGNDWRNVVNSSMDVRDDGLHNGSAGVQFVSNHDGGGADMSNVAYAYILTQPGNAIVYYNAKQFGTGRSFPVDGRGDALGNYGDTITELAQYPRNARPGRLPRTMVGERILRAWSGATACSCCWTIATMRAFRT